MAKVQFRIKGRPPGMLQNNPINKLKRQQPGPKQIPKPEVEAELGTYRDENGNLLFPIAAVKKSMSSAAVGHKVGSTAVTTIIRNNIWDVYGPDGDVLWMCLTDADGNPLVEYEINVQRAVVKTAAVLRARPLLKEWYTSVVIEHDEKVINAEMVREYLQRAGKVIGWGDYRPEKSGIYGRFDVIETKVIS